MWELSLCSWFIAAISCTPNGKPALVQYKGTDIAGWPVRLANCVNGIFSSASSAIFATQPPLTSLPPRFILSISFNFRRN